MLNPARILFLLLNISGIKPNQEFIQSKIKKSTKQSTPQTNRIKGSTRKAIKKKASRLQAEVYSSWAWSHST